ncbi:hypothetical protein K1719_021600 [Acacia pycnantha]|nr:hypothetical protein K1719_021600 [Acacia pycnantha]
MLGQPKNLDFMKGETHACLGTNSYLLGQAARVSFELARACFSQIASSKEIRVCSGKLLSLLEYLSLVSNGTGFTSIGFVYVSYSTGFVSIRFLVWEISLNYPRSPSETRNRGEQRAENRPYSGKLSSLLEHAARADIFMLEPPASSSSQKWKSCEDEGDKYINEDVAAVASKIDSLEQQSSQGSFTPGTRQDILSTAIGKPDYPDAVRGETRGVSVAKFFGRRSLDDEALVVTVDEEDAHENNAGDDREGSDLDDEDGEGDDDGNRYDGTSDDDEVEGPNKGDNVWSA